MVELAIHRLHRGDARERSLERPPERRDDKELQGDYRLHEVVPAWERYDQEQERFSAKLKRWLVGRQRTPIPSYIGCIEDPPGDGEGPKTGVCCSGGGIRSAAFNLGALQQIQGRDEDWKGVKYLAAVSGGSYIAAAFSMVAKTKDPEHPKETEDDSDPEVFARGRPPFYHGSPEEQYLRNRSSYMAPGGLGRILLASRVALGLLVNLAFLTAGIVLLAWALSLFYEWQHPLLQRTVPDASASTRDWEWGVIIVFGALALVLGLVAFFLGTRWDRVRAALEAQSLRALGVALVALLVAVAIPELIEFLRNRYGARGTAQHYSLSRVAEGVGAVAGGGFGGLLVAVLAELRSRLTEKNVDKAKSWYSKLGVRARMLLVQTATWVIGPLLLALVLVLTLLAIVSTGDVNHWLFLGIGTAFATFWVLADATSWSLHPFYRRRLCTAFALKRVKFHTDDAGDFGIALERDYRKLVPLSQSGVTTGPGDLKGWPALIVCAAANVSDPGATPPGRMVTSFTFSPFAMGGPLVGGVRTEDFENCIAPRRRRDFTLAAAVAVSGAAISPSMGKETRGSIRFLMGLANVRLGVWVPNPRRANTWLEPSGRGRIALRTALNRRNEERFEGARVNASCAAGVEEPMFRKALFIPRAGPRYLIREMLGRNDVNAPFLYVTDGGHYENLGLVELLRRGCTEIFCFDASGGTRLDALGDAIALARSELRVEITDLDVGPLEEDEETRVAERCCVRGRIKYPRRADGTEGPEGVLVYARTVVPKEAAYDVQAFRIRDEDFPHHSTLDQLYTDEKFEAYRELGAHAAREALKLGAEARRERAESGASSNGAAPQELERAPA